MYRGKEIEVWKDWEKEKKYLLLDRQTKEKETDIDRVRVLDRQIRNYIEL